MLLERGLLNFKVYQYILSNMAINLSVCSRYFILIPLMCLGGCYPAYVTQMAIDTQMKDTFPQTLKFVEVIKTSDGNNVTVNAKSSGRTHSLIPDGMGYAGWSSKDTGWPIVFDVVNKTPWVVAPVEGRQCSQFDFPREGLVFFKFDGKLWKQVPYEQAPNNLRTNLLQNLYGKTDGYGNNMIEGSTVDLEMRQSLDARANIHRSTRYINEDGSGKAIAEIVGVNLDVPNIENVNSCYFRNPILDADEKRSLREFVDHPPLVLKADLVRIENSEAILSAEEETNLSKNSFTRGDCAQKIRRKYVAQLARENQEEFAAIAGVPSGSFKSPGTAVRVEVNSGQGVHSFYLPRRGFRVAEISMLNCQADRIVVEFDRDGNVLPIFEYDLNARLKKKLKVQLPFDPKEWHVTYELSISNDRISKCLSILTAPRQYKESEPL